MIYSCSQNNNVSLRPQWLDGTEICRSERIGAAQGLEEVRRRVWEQEREYVRRREEDKAAGQETGNKDISSTG